METVILSTVVSDILGHLQIKADPGKTELDSMERRVSRRPTLDGNSVVEDYGFSHSDRTLIIASKLSKAKMDSLTYLVENSTSIMVSTSNGLFLGVFQDLRAKGSETVIKILIKEKLA